MLGLKFRRQQVIGGFVVDFYCPALRLVLEIDGEVHGTIEQQTYDLTRTEYLQSRDVKVFRISNSEVTHELLRQRLLSEFPLSIHGEGDRG